MSANYQKKSLKMSLGPRKNQDLLQSWSMCL